MDQYLLSHQDRLDVMQLYQDVSLTIQQTLQLDPMDRLILMEMIAAHMRNEAVAPTVASISRATGRSYSTVYSRVKNLEEQKYVLVDEDGGLRIADPDVLGLYEEFIRYFVDRMTPIVTRIVTQSGGTITLPKRVEWKP